MKKKLQLLELGNNISTTLTARTHTGALQESSSLS